MRAVVFPFSSAKQLHMLQRMSSCPLRARSSAVAALVCTSLLGHAAPAEPDVRPDDLPRVAPTEPARALETFQARPGFKLDLVAAEPLVMDPIAVAFDESGRMFVVEMRDYSERRAERMGRIRMLEDRDDDGRFDRATVFAEDLTWPTAVICYDGGVFVGATPDILYLKDTTGDGVADRRDQVFTGFGEGVQRLNVQQLLNSFTWGLDNRIHGANGGNGGTIRSLSRPSNELLELRGRDFSFDPRTRSIRAESGGGQYGMTFDDRGRKFVCSNSSHIRAVMYEERYASRHPFIGMPPPSVDIAVDGPAAEVYRISPEEPWRVIRTRWRVAGLVPGPIEGGGRASGYFTSATGIMIYRGDAWPDEFRGDAFIADCGSNLLHRKKVRADGCGFLAERAADEQKREFLASSDVWFRPVQMANAPDGTLYVIDMYREIIEHPWSFPASIKQHLDLNSGNDRGRIYRVAPESYQHRLTPKLGSADVRELVRTLQHSNAWHRLTAARLLYQRQDPAAAPELRKVLLESPSALGRLHALWALHSMGRLSGAEVALGLRDVDSAVRQNAIRLMEELEREEVDRVAARPLLAQLAGDPDPGVKYQLAFTLGALDIPEKLALLERLARAEMADRWMRLAVVNSVGSRAAEFLQRFGIDREVVVSTPALPLLRALVTIVGAENRPGHIQGVLAALGDVADLRVVCALGSALAAGTRQAGTFLWRVAAPAQVDRLLTAAERELQRSGAPVESRVEAVLLLGHGPFDRVRVPLFGLLETGQPALLQKAALETLGNLPDQGIAQELLNRWDLLPPSLRSPALETMLRRPERVDALLSALENGRLRPTDLSASQVDQLRERAPEPVRSRATKLLGRRRDLLVEAARSRVRITAHRHALVASTSCQGPGPMGNMSIEQGKMNGTTWFDPEQGALVESSVDQSMRMSGQMGGPGNNAGGAKFTSDIAQKVNVKLVEATNGK